MPTTAITAKCSQGTITLTPTHLKVKLGYNERIIQRSAITEVSMSLGLFVYYGFLRSLTIYAAGQSVPLKLKNMRKSKALAIKRELGF